MVDYKQLADKILNLIGGEENVYSVTHCTTRLRFKLMDKKLANKKAIEDLPEVIQVMEIGGQYQLVIGSDVYEVYRELLEIADFDSLSVRKNNFNQNDGLLGKIL
ncbi:MAG TPA: PTS transporter subunit EIIB, partial [Niallia sp.]|nr:PTS transporter subunit EIIB [Niallia sp.]